MKKSTGYNKVKDTSLALQATQSVAPADNLKLVHSSAFVERSSTPEVQFKFPSTRAACLAFIEGWYGLSRRHQIFFNLSPIYYE